MQALPESIMPALGHTRKSNQGFTRPMSDDFLFLRNLNHDVYYIHVQNYYNILNDSPCFDFSNEVR
jgi:hypothetical protein